MTVRQDVMGQDDLKRADRTVVQHALPPFEQRGALAWMAGNSVAANLLMAVLLVGGLLAGMTITQEVLPEFSLDTINIAVPYAGASPEAVESGIVLAVEEAIQDLEGIDEITASANEGAAVISVVALDGVDINRLWQEVKAKVDRIATFPEEAKDPVVTIASRKREVMRFALYGDVPETTIREMADQVRDILLLNPVIAQVALEGVRDREIQIELKTATLRQYGLTLAQVSQAISRASVELGAGAIKSDAGDILLRVKDRRSFASQYEGLAISPTADGPKLVLGDIADVTEGFEASANWASFNGQRAVTIAVFRVGDQTPIEVAEAAKQMMAQINAELPEGMVLSIVKDRAKLFGQRADLMLRNAYLGLGLVFIFLAIFLEIRLAFWVSLGIPISFLGAFLFLSSTGFSINMVSMFAFIVTLGIVVDDAVVVGENVYYYRRLGLPFMEAAIRGVQAVAMPVVFSVITNVVAFVPLMFIPGILGKVFKPIPFVVIAVFLVSLIESLFILPAHLSHQTRESIFPLNLLERWQRRFSLWFEGIVRRVYGGVLSILLAYRYSVIAFGIALFFITIGYVASGRMGIVPLPKVESDYAFCEVILPFGTPEKRLKAVEDRVVESARKVISENGGTALSNGIFSNVNDNRITIKIYLTDPDVRPMSTAEVTRRWRENTGRIPGIETLNFESDRGGPGSGKNLTVALSHRDKKLLDKAGDELARRLGEYSIVQDIDDGSAKGKRQFDILLSEAGRRMGLTSRDVANQIRHAFQGVDALSLQRGNSEVTVRVRLNRDERIAEYTFEELVLQAPKGEIMLRDAVETFTGRAYTTIKRTNGKREIRVTANVRPPSQTENVLKDMKKDILPELEKKYPGLSYSFKGAQADIRKSITALAWGLGLALLCVFALLAIPFKSYFQPLIIMFCIPFGVIGAIAGHLIMGYSLSIMSMLGLVAMSGVVVNDSLVLIDFANRQVREGVSARLAVHAAGVQRFRPILLTTLTTCGGLAPMITETSRQARFLIPMAISLGFGILFATFITLLLVPCLYMVLEDVRALWTGERR